MLVHCVAGVSRSPTIVIAYLMRSRGISLREAYDVVRTRRSIVNPNFGFMKQLIAFERTLGAKHPSLTLEEYVPNWLKPHVDLNNF